MSNCISFPQFIEGKEGKEDQMITQYRAAMAKKDNVSERAVDDEDFAAKLEALKSKKSSLTNAKASTEGAFSFSPADCEHNHENSSRAGLDPQTFL
jgi:hypothetical protein